MVTKTFFSIMILICLATSYYTIINAFRQPIHFKVAGRREHRTVSRGSRFLSHEHQAETPVLSDHAPSWDSLLEQILTTKTGASIAQDILEREMGMGNPHTDAVLRLHDDTNTKEEAVVVAEEEDAGLPPGVRVTFFRDEAAWCPYCQKVWLFLELKRIPYAVKKVPLNAYSDKPAWYTRKVDGGKLPAIELDGEVHVESMDIMKLLEKEFPNHGPVMTPSCSSSSSQEDDDRAICQRFADLMQLELELQRDWFSLTFYPVKEEALLEANQTFVETLIKVDKELGVTPGPWFLGGEEPSLVDIQYITQIERIIPSVLYWKGLSIRNAVHYPNLNRWLTAFEKIPAYLASRADFYNHISVIPSQNGPGYMIPEAKQIANQICGLSDGAWRLPLNLEESLEPFPELNLKGSDYEPAHEAAYKLISNHANIIRFACRGAGEPGRPSFHAELADPYAEPNDDYTQAVDVSLRHVANALLHKGGVKAVLDDAKRDLYGKGGNNELRENWEAYPDESDESLFYYWNWETGDVTWTPPTQQLDTCLSYLRDRIGVPRDMGPAAAMHLRAQLNWAIELMKG